MEPETGTPKMMSAVRLRPTVPAKVAYSLRKEPYQCDERQHEKPALSDRVESARHFAFIETLHSEAPRFKIDHYEDGYEVENGRNDSRLDDLDIGQAKRFSHDEGDGPMTGGMI